MAKVKQWIKNILKDASDLEGGSRKTENGDFIIIK